MKNRVGETTVETRVGETTVVSRVGETTVVRGVGETTVVSKVGETTVVNIVGETTMKNRVGETTAWIDKVGETTALCRDRIVAGVGVGETTPLRRTGGTLVIDEGVARGPMVMEGPPLANP